MMRDWSSHWKSCQGRAGSINVAGWLQTNREHCLYSAPFFVPAPTSDMLAARFLLPAGGGA